MAFEPVDHLYDVPRIQHGVIEESCAAAIKMSG
jgi:hypothetical protein